MSKKYKIVLVDDHTILRNTLKFTLSQLGFAEVVAEASNGKEFLELLENVKPDIVLMDIAMPEMDGLEATKQALTKIPDLKIIALTMFGDQEYYFKMIHAGASGFVLKKSGIDELEMAIKSVAGGQNYFSNEILRNIIINIGDNKLRNVVSGSAVKLTKRETQVLIEICNGLSNNEISELLYISPKTVEGHRNNLLAKTNSKNTANLVMYAIKHKLVEV